MYDLPQAASLVRNFQLYPPVTKNPHKGLINMRAHSPLINTLVSAFSRFSLRFPSFNRPPRPHPFVTLFTYSTFRLLYVAPSFHSYPTPSLFSCLRPRLAKRAISHETKRGIDALFRRFNGTDTMRDVEPDRDGRERNEAVSTEPSSNCASSNDQ